MPDKVLSGKTSVVTGGGRGIGRSIALLFARQGADVAICSRTQKELGETQRLVESEDVRCVAKLGDLTQRSDAEAFCNTVLTEFGHVNVLVNNAGGSLERNRVSESDIDLWRKTIEVNLFSSYMVTRLLLEAIPEGGKIINISSGMAGRASNANSAYHVAKAGLHMFTEALANEVWKSGIEVNNLIPGPVATSTFNRDDPSDRKSTEEIMAIYRNGLPDHFPVSERIKHPDEVAELALYLATQRQGGPTAQTFSLARRPF